MIQLQNLHRRRSEFERAGADWNVRGAVGIEMLTFEAKREILQKFGKNWGDYSPPSPPSSGAHDLYVPRIYKVSFVSGDTRLLD